MEKKTLGIIGGVGPLATMFIGEMIVRLTDAEKDQDHVNMVITNNTNIPDRTAFILGESTEDPVPVIVSDAHRLEQAGAEIIAIPCNTAHSFYEEIDEGTTLPVIDMIRETAMRAKEIGAAGLESLAQQVQYLQESTSQHVSVLNGACCTRWAYSVSCDVAYI